ncbi:sugar phosphate isomerase/epimerase family protein [Lacticaseibacillus suihuaensis]
MVTIGLNTGCAPADMPMATIFTRAKAAGYDHLELDMVAATPQAQALGLLTEAVTDAELTQMAALSRDAGLAVSSVSTGLHWQAVLSSPDAAVRARGIAVARRMIDAAQAVGGDTVLIVPAVIEAGTDYQAAYDRAQASLAAIGDYASGTGVAVGVENVWNNFLMTPLAMRQFITELNHPAIGAYFDVGNVLQCGFPEQWLHVLAELVLKVHVKDFRTSIGNIQGFVPLLAGDVNWPAVMAALKDIGYNGAVTAEVPPYRYCADQAIDDTANALRRIQAL